MKDEKIKYFFPKIFKDILERENIDYKNNLIECDKNKYEFLLKQIEKKDIISKDLINEELLKFFPKNILLLKVQKEISLEIKTIFNKLYGNLEIEDELEYRDLKDFIYYLFDRLLKTFLQNHLVLNLNNGLEEYKSGREVIEFEKFMNYNFFKEYLEFYFPLILTIIDLQKNIFISNIKANDDLKNNFLEETRKFYNILLNIVKHIKSTFQIHKNKLYLERHIIKKSEVLRFNFYDELEELKKSFEKTIKKFEEFENNLIENKLFVVNKIKENKREFREDIINSIGDISHIIGRFFGGIFK